MGSFLDVREPLFPACAQFQCSDPVFLVRKEIEKGILSLGGGFSLRALASRSLFLLKDLRCLAIYVYMVERQEFGHLVFFLPFPHAPSFVSEYDSGSQGMVVRGTPRWTQFRPRCANLKIALFAGKIHSWRPA